MARFFLLLAVASFSATLLHAQSGDPSELFLNAYMAVQQGEKLEADGKYKPALSKYRYAGSLLDQVHDKFPTWQPLIVEYRKKRTSESIEKLDRKMALEAPATGQAPTGIADVEPPLPESGGVEKSNPSLTVTPPGSNDMVDRATQEIRQRIEQLQVDLKEARTQLTSVKQEKEDLASRLDQTVKQLNQSKVGEAELRAKLGQAQDALKNAKSDQNFQGKKALQEQIASLKNALQDARADRDVADEADEEIAQRLTQARKEVASLTQERDEAKASSGEFSAKLAEAQKRATALQEERDAMRGERDKAVADLAEARKANEQVDKLMADNSALTQKLSEAQKTIEAFSEDTPKKDAEIASLKKEVNDAKEELAASAKQNTDFQASMADLQGKLDTTTAELTQLKASGGNAGEKKKLVDENDLLRGIVLRQLRDQARRDQSKKLVLAELAKLEVKSSALLEQIDYLGQPVVKLTEKERALFKQPQIAIAETESTDISIAAPMTSVPTESPAPAAEASATPATELAVNTTPTPAAEPPLPSDAAPTPMPGKLSVPAKGSNNPQVETGFKPKVPEELLPTAREAKENFDRGQYRESEKAYEKMLSKAPNNVYILSNLGVVRFKSGKLKLAEEAFKKSIAIAPDDAFSRSTLGIVYYSQGKYDEAVNELTRALAANPKNPTAHNYLGITASQKGWPEAARKELETAIALDPNYPDANFNLAVVYATQQPPNKDLARKYYKRAVELGAEADPALEQLTK